MSPAGDCVISIAMNSPFAHRHEGPARRLFRVDDLFRMAEAGVIRPDERLEVIDGDVLETSPKGLRHEWLKTGLNRYFGQSAPESVQYTQEAGWQIDAFTYLEPDFLFYPAGLRLDAVKPTDALLIVEVADSSFNFDLGPKAALYSRLGVREYWVIDAAERVTHVHLMPKPDGYGAVRPYGADILVQPSLIAGMPLRLADMPA